MSATKLPHEPLAHFLQRLPPASAPYTTPRHLLPRWYWIANPHATDSPQAADSTGGDVAAFASAGAALLAEFRQAAALQSNVGRVDGFREVLAREIGVLAKRYGVAVGKWMLFPRESEVNEVWRAVCEGVDAGRLGVGAKVSTSGLEGDPARLICVYTRDFTDVADVRRVLDALVALGLVRADMPQGIMYKCDAYTHLGIYEGNEYGLRASMYGSREMLAGGWGGGLGK
ncbi:uncharacterized protein B0H64DRAFT_418904 [Chaetomium fimeti]|uniref:DUF1917-domain-containing protein n=1 Tax=Chaetomium fimeti TaxID=1854472 RepID=A0AAE0LPV2_9PEZI|nr:hypothetical protein B0H64DRAFT_418904 [Chaetomium fimeti]